MADQTRACPSCGAEVGPLDAVCPSCGKALPPAESVPAPPGAGTPPAPPVPRPPLPGPGPAAAEAEIDVDELLRTAIAQRRSGETLEKTIERIVGDRFGAASEQVVASVKQTVRLHAVMTGTSFDEAAAQLAAGDAELKVTSSNSAGGEGSWAAASQSVVIRSSTSRRGLKALPPELRAQVREFMRQGGDPDEMPPALRQQIAEHWAVQQQAGRRSRGIGCFFSLLALCRVLLGKL